MKARPLKPQFWRDPVVSRWGDSLRLFYIGLWMLCDDQGVFQSDPLVVGAELYPYQPSAPRLRNVTKMMGQLVDAGKVQMLPCHRHGVVPSVPEHPMGGRPTDQYQREH